MILSDPNRAEAFLQMYRDSAGYREFHASPDAQRLLDGETFGGILDRLLQTATDPTFPGALLPRPDAGTLRFYLASPDARQWRMATECLIAFCGPSHSDFSGRTAQPTPGDAVERLLFGQPGIHAVGRFRIAPEKGTLPALKALLRMVASFHAVPEMRVAAREPTSVLLQRFRYALLAQNEEEVDRIWTELRSDMHLDALNLTFLRVQHLAAFGKWAAIRAMPQWEHLLGVRRPTRVTQDLAEALYASALQLHEDEDAPADLIQRYSRDARADARQLLSRPGDPARSPGLLKLLALEAVMDSDARDQWHARLSLIAQTEPSTPFSRLWRRLLRAGLISEPPSQRAATPARELGLPQLIATDQPPGVPTARAVLLAADAQGTLEGYRAAAEYVAQLSEQDLAALMARPWVQALWHEIEEHSGGIRTPRNWGEWVRLLDDEGFTNSFALAEQGAAEWDITMQLADPPAVGALADALLDVREGTARERFSQALPVLVEWLANDPRYPNGSLLPVYRSLLSILALNPRRGSSELQAVGVLALGILMMAGADAGAYRDTLDELGLIAETSRGQASLDWLIDMLELTAQAPAAEPAAREAFCYQSMDVIRPDAHWLEDRHRRLLHQVLRSLGQELAKVPWLASPPREAEGVIGSAIESLPPLRIGIYSLLESAANRARQVIQEINERLQISVNSEQEGSERLKALARNSDVLIVAPASAKHAATLYITQHRPKEATTLFAHGKGASSLLRALEEFARTTSGV